MMFKLEQLPPCAHFTAIFPFYHLKPTKKNPNPLSWPGVWYSDADIIWARLFKASAEFYGLRLHIQQGMFS